MMLPTLQNRFSFFVFFCFWSATVWPGAGSFSWTDPSPTVTCNADKSGSQVQDVAASIVVALAGGSGAGKNYLRDVLQGVFGEASVSTLSHDWYYKDQTHLSLEERDRLNFDHPDALDSSLLLEHIKVLQRGEVVRAPVYDFKSHSRSGLQTINPAPLVLVDGILLLAEPLLADAFDLRIYVDTPADIRLLRRIARDVKERGRSLEGILHQYEMTVRPMHELFVETSKARADMIIPGMAGANFKALLKVIGGLTGLKAQ